MKNTNKTLDNFDGVIYTSNIIPVVLRIQRVFRLKRENRKIK